MINGLIIGFLLGITISGYYVSLFIKKMKNSYVNSDITDNFNNEIEESILNTYDPKTYEQDFPPIGDLNWKTVRFKTPNDPYYDGHEKIGVVLHDGNFMCNGVLMLKDQFEIIDENPFTSYKN